MSELKNKFIGLREYESVSDFKEECTEGDIIEILGFL